MPNQINQVVINGATYQFKDLEARSEIANLGGWIVSTNANTTPYGVQWDNNGTTVTGTLEAASANNKKIYLVLSEHSSTGDIYSEWIAIQKSTTYSWEKLGETRFTGSITTDSASAVAVLVSSAHHHSVTPRSTYIKAIASGGSLNLSSHAHSISPTHKYLGASASGGAVTSSGEHSHEINSTSRYLTVVQVSGASVGVTTGSFTKETTPVVTGVTPSYGSATNTTVYSASQSLTIPNAEASLATTNFVKVNALTSSTQISITGVASRTSATVATGGTTSGTTFVTGLGTAAGTTLVTSVTPATYQKTLFNGTSSSIAASNYVQSLSSGTVTKKSVVTGLGSAMMASYRSSDEALVLTLATAASANYGVDGDALSSVTPTYKSFSVSDTTANGVSMTKRDFTKAGLATTTVYSANAPTSISAAISGTTEVIGASITQDGQIKGISLGTGISNSSITIYPASNSVSVVTGLDSAPIVGVSLATTEVISKINGTSTFLTGASISSQQTNKIFAATASSANAILVVTNVKSTTGNGGAHTHEFTQPTISIASYDSSATGRVKYAASVPSNTGSSGSASVGITDPPTITLSTSSQAQTGSVVVAIPEEVITNDVSTVVSGSNANYITSVSFS